MRSTMMAVDLSLNRLLARAGTHVGGHRIVWRLPDKSLRRHTCAGWHRRTRALPAEPGFARWQWPDRHEVIDMIPRSCAGQFLKAQAA